MKYKPDTKPQASRYAHYYTSRDARQFRLEYFNGKAYEVDKLGTWEQLQPENTPRVDARPWRLTLVEKARDLKPRYRAPARGRTGYSRTIREVQEAYIKWATDRGLTMISTYYGMPVGGKFQCRAVDPADTFGPAVDEYGFMADANEVRV